MSKLSDFFSAPGSGGGDTSEDIYNSDVFADIVIVGGGGGATLSCSTQSVATTAPTNVQAQAAHKCGWAGGGGGAIYRLRYGLRCGQTYPITVGAGGAAGPSDVGIEGNSQASNGSPSKFDGSRFIAYGGGGAGSIKTCCGFGQDKESTMSHGRAGGQGGIGAGSFYSSLAASHSSFGSRYGFHYGNSDAIYFGQICPSDGQPGIFGKATAPVNGYDLSGSSACDTIARGGWYCFGKSCTCPPEYTPTIDHCCVGCAYSAGQANSGDGAGSCNGPAAGGSGFVVVSYPDVHRAAPARPGSNDCSACTPGYRTYVFTSSGSITL